jgi:hypothetical protein
MIRRLSKWDGAVLTLMAAGAYFRLYPLFYVPFTAPFHLGGLFYEFSQQILNDGFALPKVIPFYSAGGIPFAYPPLSFYAQAIAIKLFHPPLFVTVNLIPPLVAVLSLPAFYWMAKQVSDNTLFAVSALAVFAFMPAAFSNQIEAAGLAEAFGLLALIFYVGCLFRFERLPGLMTALAAGLSLALSILSSPGSAYGSVVISALFFIKFLLAGFKTHRFSPLGWLVVSGLVGAVLSAPYWGTVINYHGINLFLVPFLAQNGQNFPLRLAALGVFNASGSDLGLLWNWLAFGGLLWALLNRQIFMALFLLVFWLVPREGVWLVAIPASLLAAYGFVNILLPLVQKSLPEDWKSHPPLAPGLLAIVFLAIAYTDADVTLYQMLANEEWRVTPAEVQSVETLAAHIPQGARLLVMGNEALNEWAPQLFQREVINEKFGLEWQPDEAEKIERINKAWQENDFEAMHSALVAYTGKGKYYLLASPDSFTSFEAHLPAGVSLSSVAATPDLSLGYIEIK